MKLLLLIPDGVGMRNFLLGRFLRQVVEKGQACVLHVVPDNLLACCKAGLDGNVRWEGLIPYRETPLSSTLRYSLAYAQVFWANTRAMRHVRSIPVRGSWRRRTVDRTARLIGHMAASSYGVQRLDRWHCRAVSRLPEVERYRRLFQQIRPSVLFCSHQRPPIILPPVLAARSLGIPTATFIFSWDNLTSKGRIAAPFDHYLVWSSHMREELLHYYPDVSVDRVHVVGTPQFDPYADNRLILSRVEFFNRIGANPARPLICYSGGDTGTCPEDPQHVRILLELIRAGRIQSNTQVLLRPAPVDEGSRYNQVRGDYPELIYARPDWLHTELNNWAHVIPQPNDVEFLANLTYYVDLNINLCSTMTLDFAIHDKPVINIAFDVASPPPFRVPLWNYFYQFEHYRPVVELGAARFARSPEELAQHVNTYLQNPALDRDARRRLVALQVGRPIGQSSHWVLKVLQNIARD